MAKEYIYYWYDHLVLRFNGDAEKVSAAIETKDFDTFLKFKKKYSRSKWLYFPDVIHVWDDSVGDFVEDLDVNVRENINMITHAEYECG